MGQDTKIEWAKHSFNFWIGCQAVGPECQFCYAEAQNKFRGWVDGWGPHGERRVTSASTWKNPPRWDRAAAKAGEVHSVFCNSLADFFDNKAPAEARAYAFKVMEETPNLLWLILTKRPQNIIRMVEADGIPGPFGKRRLPRNAALGTSAGNQQQAHLMIPHILRAKAALDPAFVFVSSEPLLGPIDYSRWIAHLDWIIAGGESGAKARLMDEGWARSARDQCAAVGVPFFMKQMTKKAAIPDDLLVRELPNAARS